MGKHLFAGHVALPMVQEVKLHALPGMDDKYPNPALGEHITVNADRHYRKSGVPKRSQVAPIDNFQCAIRTVRKEKRGHFAR
jgi:hypothetical protein